MKKKNGFSSLPGKLWNFFTSIKLTVVVFISLAVTSIIGTVIPQNAETANYINSFGEKLYGIFRFFGIFDMYHSWWFRFLLLVLTISILVCSIDRLSATWNIIFAKIPKFNVSRFRKLSGKEEFITRSSLEALKKNYAPVVLSSFRYSTIEENDRGFCIFAEKGRWTRLGVYIVHLSVILLIMGSILGSMFGFEGYVNIPEGDTINSIMLRKTGQKHSLDIGIRCDDFDVTFYDTGAPKEYRSALSIIENGKHVLSKDIIVNDPLRYKGLNIFQSSYGSISPKEITLKFTSKKTGKEYAKKLTVGEHFDMPEDMGKFLLRKVVSSYNFYGRDVGESVLGTLIHDNGKHINIVIPIHYPNFDKMRKGDIVISVKDFTHHYFTGLQVTRDPGVPVVYTAFIIMIIGFYVTFFMSHQRLCIEVVKNGDKSDVAVAGFANKNQFGMDNKVRKIAHKLARIS